MDLSQLSDDELMKAAGIGQNKADLSNYSDDELAKAAGIGINQSSFLGDMKANFDNAVQSGKDLLSGNWQDIGATKPTPKTEALADKLFPQGSDGSFMGAMRNIGNTSPSDFSGALLEKFGETPEGKALAVIGGVNPLYNAAGTAINRYVNPAISEATGIHPDNLALGEMLAGTAGFKKAGTIKDPTVTLAKKVWDLGESGAPRPRKSPTALTSEQVASNASNLYKQANQQGGKLKPEFTNRFLSEIEKATPQTEAGKLLAGDSPVTKVVERMRGLKNKAIDLAEAQEIDEFLGDAVDGFTEMGRVTKQGKKLLDIQTSLRRMIDDASDMDVEGGKAGFDSLKSARAEWAKAASLRDIEKIMTRAEQMDNPATGIKTGFRTLYNNPARMRGFTPQEKILIKRAAESGVASDILRTFGSRLVPIINVASGGGMAGGALAQGASMASRGAATAVQAGKAQKVINAISNRGAAPNPPLISNMPKIPIGSATIGAAETLGAMERPMGKKPLPVQDKRSEINPEFLERTKQAESGGNPNAQSPTSSASGLYQFTDQTWNDSVKKWGNELGISLADKNNPQAQEAMVQKLAADNARILISQLNKEPSIGDMYAAHFLGANDAVRLIKAQGTNREAFRLFPKAAQANKTIFFDRARPRTVEEVYRLLASKVA